jgi:hypothetical protein
MVSYRQIQKFIISYKQKYDEQFFQIKLGIMSVPHTNISKFQHIIGTI